MKVDGALLSVVTPVYNEAECLPIFAGILRQTLDAAGIRWEWLAVEDASTDDSRRILNDIAAREPRLRVLPQPVNSGSHAAILRGLREARGDFAVALAADLQDPPEIIPRLLREAQRSEPSLVWAARLRSSGATPLDRFLATSYHLAVRLWTGLPDPQFGADCFLARRDVLDTVARWPDPGSSLFFRLLALPVRQRSIRYERRDRVGGVSSWTMKRKLHFAISSLLSGTNPASWLARLTAILWRTGQLLAAPGSGGTLDRLIREWLAQHPDCQLHLDAGCGSHSRLRAAGVEVVGVDSDAQRIALFRNRGGDGVVASSTSLPFCDGIFDAVWSFGLLHHLTDVAFHQTLAEMGRVTRPGGWLIVFDALPPLKPRRRPLAAWIRRMDAGQHLRTEAELRASLAVSGTWECHRLTYAWNGLEALYCTHHNQPTSPLCPSPPTSN